MQNASVSDDVDEEQGIGDDGSKSSRSHRALEDSGLRFLALKKGRQLSRLPRWQPLKHMWRALFFDKRNIFLSVGVTILIYDLTNDETVL
jgi:hypothetical protein